MTPVLPERLHDLPDTVTMHTTTAQLHAIISDAVRATLDQAFALGITDVPALAKAIAGNASFQIALCEECAELDISEPLDASFGASLPQA